MGKPATARARVRGLAIALAITLGAIGSVAVVAAAAAPGDAGGPIVPRSTPADRLTGEFDSNAPRNTIVLLLDGFDEQLLTAARNYELGADGRFLLDELPFRGVVTTHGLLPGSGPNYGINYVNDSAATASAWATGQKTLEGRISQGPSSGLSVPGQDLESVMLRHKRQGKLTANISDVDVTDATPAAMGASINNRSCQGPQDMGDCPDARKQNGGKGSIAEQMVDNGIDVILGGGFRRFAQATDAGPSVLDYATNELGYQDVGDGDIATADELEQVDSLDDGPVLGLFADGYMTTRYQPLVAETGGAGSNNYRCAPQDRGEQPTLAEMTSKALELVDNPNGFFMQVESASTDKRAHESDVCGSLGQVLEADRALEVMLDYQEQNPDTLVVVTSDHGHATQIVRPGEARRYATVQTADGSPMSVGYSSSEGTGQWHTGVEVPIAAKGPQAANVSGVMDQTELYDLLVGYEPDDPAERTEETEAEVNPSKPRNTIVLLLDGFDEQLLTAARNYELGADGRFLLDELPFRGVVTTHGLLPGSGPNYGINYVNDSAATASAWATGQKTLEGRISQGPSSGLSVPGQDLESVMLRHKRQGKLTANISDVDVTDATPAAMGASINNRSCQGPQDMGDCPDARKQNGGKGSIAEQMVDNGIDVILGGGFRRFAQATDAGPSVLDYATNELGYQDVGDGDIATADELEQVDSLDDGPVLGLFADGYMTTRYQPLVAETGGAGSNNYRCAPQDRGEQPTLAEMTSKALELVDNPNGFFMQVESASTDKRAHESDVCGSLGQVLEADRALEVMLDYQEQNPDTLVVVTSDHGHATQIVRPGEARRYATVQTADGSPMSVGYSSSEGTGQWHTGVEVPIAAKGPQAANVSGVMDQTELYDLLVGYDQDACVDPAASDEFDGPLDEGWTIRREVPERWSLADGGLTIQFDGNKDMTSSTQTSTNLFLRPAPEGPWTATTQMDLSEAKEQSNQAGLMLWRSEGPPAEENTFAKIVANARTTDPNAPSQPSWWVERYAVVDGSTSGLGNANAGFIEGLIPDTVHLRMTSTGGEEQTIRTYYSLDGHQWKQFRTPFTLPADDEPLMIGVGVHRGENNPDGSVTFEHFRVCSDAVDLAHPVTSAETNPPPDGRNGWHTTDAPVEVALSATDGENGSGVESTEYRVGDGEWQDYSEPFQVGGSGTTEVRFRSVDGAGNTEPVRTLRVKRDTVAPSASAELTPPGDGPFDEPVTVEVEASDEEPGSGVARIETRLTSDGEQGEWVRHRIEAGEEARASVTVSRNGAHELEFRAVDRAGHVGTTDSVAFVIEGRDSPPCLPASDEFDGDALDGKWDVLRDSGGIEVADGRLSIPIAFGDFISDDQLAQDALLQDAPAGEWTVTAKLDTSGLDASGKQAGLLIWKGEDPNTFAKLIAIQSGSNPRFEFIVTQENSVDPPISQSITSAPGGQLPDEALVRARYTGTQVIGEFSADGGGTWIRVGSASHAAPFSEPMRIGLTAFSSNAGNVGNRAEFDWFRVHAGSAPDRGFECGEPPTCFSDEFEGGGLDTERWSFLHPTTPAEGEGAPHVDEGDLVLPLGANSLNDVRQGPIALLGQPLPEGDFTMEAQITAPGLNSDTGNMDSDYAQVGFKLFQDDDHWIKLTQTRNADDPAPDNPTYFELMYEIDGTVTLGPRVGEANAEVNLPTFWLRVERTGDAITGSYALEDPAEGGAWNDLQFTADMNSVFEPGEPVYIGPYGGNGTIEARFAYVRFEPDNVCDEPGEDTMAPTTTHELTPAEPDGDDGWYVSPVEIALNATDEGGSGVAATEYRVAGSDNWLAYTEPLQLALDGEHTIEYRSHDNAGNVEETRSVSVKVDTSPPETTAQLNGTAPQPSYDGEVRISLSASDEVSGVAASEVRVDDGEWEPLDGELTVSGVGEHVVEYRSRDVAGNVEAARSVEFEILGSPQIALAVKPAKRRVAAKRKRTAFRAIVRSTGDVAAEGVRVCARYQKRRVRLIGKRCRTLGELAAGSRSAVRFKFAIKRQARGKKTRIRFVANGPDVSKRNAAAMLIVRR